MRPHPRRPARPALLDGARSNPATADSSDAPPGRPLRSDGGTPEQPDDSESVEELLVSQGVLEEMPEVDDLQLTAEFERAWQERIESIRGGDRAVRWLAATHDLTTDDVTTETREDGFAVTVDGGPTQEWPSEAAFAAALVAEPTLSEWIPDSRWAALPEGTREGLASRLLLFLERCPACDGDLDMSEEAVEDGVRVSLACSDCETAVVDEVY